MYIVDVIVERAVEWPPCSSECHGVCLSLHSVCMM